MGCWGIAKRIKHIYIYIRSLIFLVFIYVYVDIFLKHAEHLLNKINNDDPLDRPNTEATLSIYPLSLNPNVRRRQSTMVSKAYNPYRLVWRWNSCIYILLLLLAIQVKHCKFAEHLHTNIWKIESNPSPLQPLFFERQLLHPSRWVILQRRGLHVSHVNSTAGWYAEYYIPYLSCK